jgi:hypothetical protein
MGNCVCRNHDNYTSPDTKYIWGDDTRSVETLCEDLNVFARELDIEYILTVQDVQRFLKEEASENMEK